MSLNTTIEDLQQIYEQQTYVSFKIIGISEKGFSTQIFDFNAFVSFQYMPFNYNSVEAWREMFPYLKKATFFAKISTLNIDMKFCILNANIPQFETIELDCETIYSGIIIEKFSSRTMIELGASFNWKYGSIKGTLPNSKRDRIIHSKDLKIGDSLSVYVFDGNKPKDADYLVQGSNGSKDWDNGIILEMLNKKVPAKIVSHGGQKFCLIDCKYKGELKTYRRWYKDTKFQYSIKRKIKGLQEGKEITVQIIKINERLQTMEVIWVLDEKVEEEN